MLGMMVPRLLHMRLRNAARLKAVLILDSSAVASWVNKLEVTAKMPSWLYHAYA